jgi:hypothetical protein
MFGCVHCVEVVELQKKPRGHSRHDDMPGLVAKNPLSHGKHSVGVVEYVPGSQDSQNDMPEVLAIEPASQGVHMDSAESLATAPATHGMHAESPLTGENVPGVQLVQSEEFFSDEYIPGRHISQ